MKTVTVRPLMLKDKNAVIQMDELSGNYVSQWIEDEISDYAFGIFENNKLIGYATIGYADDCPSMIEETPCYTDAEDQLLLSDVYIIPEKRHNGYGKYLCVSTMLQRLASEASTHVYAALLYDDLYRFYSSIGFTWCNPEKPEYCVMATRTDIENIAKTMNITANTRKETTDNE